MKPDSFNKINNTLIYDIGDVNGDGEVDFLDATMNPKICKRNNNF